MFYICQWNSMMFFALVAVIILLVVYYKPKQSSQNTTCQRSTNENLRSDLNIIRERYAKGEITQEEFDMMKETLNR